VNRGPAAGIDLSALRHNLASIRSIAGTRPVIAVVKADAYGHGAAAVARTLADEGVSILAVAFTGEAEALRSAGIDTPILVLFDHTDISSYFDLGLIPVLSDIGAAGAFAREARRRGAVLPVHLKVDTGMGRMGLRCDTAVADALSIDGMDGLRLEGLMSHFSEADLRDRSFASEQIRLFDSVRAEVASRLGRGLLCHMANSAAILTLPGALFDAVRPGIVLYGCSPFPEDTFGLRPVMSVKTEVLALRRLPKGCPVSYGRTFVTGRESLIAVLPVGYADGYSRLFSNNAEVLVRGQRAPVVGRVCMDLTMADVTSVEGVSTGDEVVILGSQGGETITASEMACRINTIPYEVVTSLGGRARRIYIT